MSGALGAVAAALVAGGGPDEVVRPVVDLLGEATAADAEAIGARLAAEPELADRLAALLRTGPDTGDEAATALDLAWADGYSGVGDWTAGLARATTALRRSPDDATAHWVAAGCLFRLGRRDEALVHLRRVVELDPDDAATSVLTADLAAELDARELALDLAHRAWGLAREQPLGPGLQAQLYATLDQLGEAGVAEAVLADLVERLTATGSSGDAELLANGATALAAGRIDADDFEEAHRILAGAEARIGSLSAHPAARLRLAQSLLGLRRPVDSLRYATTDLPGALPGSAAQLAAVVRGLAIVQRVDVDGDQSELAEAVELLSPAAADPDDPNRDTVAYTRGLACLLLGRVDEARSSFDEVHGRLGPVPGPDPGADGGPADHDLMRGSTSLFRGLAWADADEALARESLEEADRLLPATDARRPQLAVRLGHLLRRTDPARALALVASVPDPGPEGRLVVARTEVDALLASGRPQEALVPLGNLIGAATGLERGWRLTERAVLRAGLGDPAGARADLVEARARAAADPDLNWQLDAREIGLRIADGDLDGVDDALAALAARADERADRADQQLAAELEVALATARHDSARVRRALMVLAGLDESYALLGRYLAGETALLSGRVDADFTDFQAVADAEPGPRAIDQVVVAHARQFLRDEPPDELLARAAELDPGSAHWPLTRIVRAGARLTAGDPAGVEAALAPIGSEAEPVDPLIRLSLLGQAHMQARPRNLTGAAAAFEQLETEASGRDDELSRVFRPQVRALRALVLLSADRLDEARSALAAAREASRPGPGPGYSEAIRLEAEGLLALREERYEEAAVAFGQAAAALGSGEVPASGPVADLHRLFRFLEGLAHLNSRRPEDALRCLARADGGDPDVLAARGRAHLLLDEAALALADYRTALALETDRGDRLRLLLGRARAERQLGRYETAVGSAREALDLDPDHGEAWFVLATAHQAAGHRDAAVAAFRRSLDLRPGELVTAQALVGLSKALCDAGKAAEAVKVLRHDRHRTARDHFGVVSFNLGVALQAVGDTPAALAALEAAARAAEPADGAAAAAGALRAGRAERASWLGFWFSGQGRLRRTIGATLLVLGTAFTALLLIDRSQVGWLRWVDGSSDTRLVAPLAVVAALYLLPVVTRFKLAGVEIEQPEPKAAEPRLAQPVDWDAVGRKALAHTALVVQAGSGQPPPVAPVAADLTRR